MAKTLKDYSLTGANSQAALESGLAGAEWYRCPIPRKEMKQLMRRRDAPAIRDTLIWFALLGLTGYLAFLSWGTWWAIPAFAVYGILYGSCGDSRWHECMHGTAFRTRWLNVAVYHLASFMILRNGTLWRWSHARHHTDTIVVGRDPEIAQTRPPSFGGLLLDLLYLKTGFSELRKMARHVIGRLSDEEKDYVPEMERWKVIREARIQCLVLAGVAAWCVAIGSVMPAFFIGLPTFFGAWMDVVFFGYTQHVGLAEDVTDHRENCRTVHMNPVFRFIYWNMNYHLEHHMFPMVPYHALPELHAAMKADTPPAYPNVVVAWREILGAMWRQLKDPTYYTRRPVPGGPDRQPQGKPADTTVAAAG